MLPDHLRETLDETKQALEHHYSLYGDYHRDLFYRYVELTEHLGLAAHALFEFHHFTGLEEMRELTKEQVQFKLMDLVVIALMTISQIQSLRR